MKRRGSGRAVVMTFVAAAGLLAAVLSGPGMSAQGQSKAKKYKGTRAIVVDSTSGELRLPTQEEVDKAVQGLSSLVPQPVEQAQPHALPNGAVAVTHDGSGVVLARPRGDGTFETRCVFTFEEGADFLGIVEDESIL